MPRVYTFKGKSGDELKNMTVEQYLPLVTARQRRAYKRMSTEYKALIVKVAEAQKSGRSKPVRTHVREALILPSWLGSKIAVYTGTEFKELTIIDEMLGHRLGEYAFTTKRVMHSAPGVRATRGSKFLAVK